VNLQTLQEKVAERVRAIPLLASLPVVEEQKGSIIDAVQTAVEKDSFCVVVETATFSDEAPDSTVCYGTARIAVTVFEDPEMNRHNRSARPTAMNAAQEIAKALKLFRPDVPGTGHLTTPSIGAAQEVGEGVISITTTLSVKTTL